MTSFHSRSNSFPSQSHPVTQSIEDHLCRLRSSHAASTSAISLCENMAGLRDLHNEINNMIQMPSIQQVLSHEQGQSWTNELLEGSLKLVDLCEFTREAVCLIKESIQDLESSIRRNGGETDDIKVHVASRKIITKMVKKYIKNNLKSFNQNSKAILDIEFGKMLNDADQALNISVLKNVLTLVSGGNGVSERKSWSFLSKFTQTRKVHSENDEYDLCLFDIQEVEEGLESLFRSLVNTRVALLNVISH